MEQSIAFAYTYCTVNCEELEISTLEQRDQIDNNNNCMWGNDDEFKTQNNLDKMQKEFIATRYA